MLLVERGQDHYQNMEVNNLLQEIERFEGIVILTTNLEANMDEAFSRRILYKVDFPLPGPEERAAIWRALVPSATPCDRVDFDEVGDLFELSGGQIKNAILRAAYRCIASGQGLHQAALEEAAHHELASAGRLCRRRPIATSR